MQQIPASVLDDYQQIDLALAGDQRAYTTLYKRYYKSLFYRIYKLVHNEEQAKDLTMETFSKAFGSLFRFRKDYRFSTWLYRIGINHSLDFLRKKRLPTHPLSVHLLDDSHELDLYQDSRTAAAESPEIRLAREERSVAIRHQLLSLPLRYQRLMDLRYFKDYSYQEIAREVDLPVGTVKSHLHHGRKLLHQKLRFWRADGFP